jgi:hypothetical protein
VSANPLSLSSHLRLTLCIAIGFDNVGWPFWFWVISGNVVAVIFAFLLCPETGGKTLEQVDYLFIDKGFAGLRKNFDVTSEDMEGHHQGDSELHAEKSEAIETESGEF